MAGSIGSHTVVGAPDITVITLSELAEQTHRMTRASALPIIIDGEGGYGNALNVKRCVEEMEHSGCAAVTIEDTLLPRPYAGNDGSLIPREEFRDKLRAAIAARIDKSFCVIGRTALLRGDYVPGGSMVRSARVGDGDGLDETIERCKIAVDCGVDGMFVQWTTSLEQVQAIHDAVPMLRLVLNTDPAPYDELAAAGARVVFQGHQAFYVAIKAVDAYYKALRAGGRQAIGDMAASGQLQRQALAEAEFSAWARDYLAAPQEARAGAGG
jgi:carboxyvinyl-carboxyphosphonate phosphorylmutase